MAPCARRSDSASVHSVIDFPLRAGPVTSACSPLPGVDPRQVLHQLHARGVVELVQHLSSADEALRRRRELVVEPAGTRCDGREPMGSLGENRRASGIKWLQADEIVNLTPKASQIGFPKC